jgi:hypothetical protein
MDSTPEKVMLVSMNQRFTLESSLSKYNNFKNTISEFKFDLIKKIIIVGFYEIFNEHKDVLTAKQLENWIFMDHSMDLLKFKSYDSIGNVLREVNFQGLKVIADECSFNYDENKFLIRKITLEFNKFTKDVTII